MTPDELRREAVDWRHNAYTRVMLAQWHDRLIATKSLAVEQAAQIAERLLGDEDGSRVGAAIRGMAS